MEINSTNPLIVSKNNVQRLETPQQSERTLKSGGGAVPIRIGWNCRSGAGKFRISMN